MVHQARAEAVLAAIARDLPALQKVVNNEAGFVSKSSNRNALLRSSNTLGAMHLVVDHATVLMAFQRPDLVSSWFSHGLTVPDRVSFRLAFMLIGGMTHHQESVFGAGTGRAFPLRVAYVMLRSE